MSKTFVPLTLITDSPYQARIDTGDTEGLADTILEHGLRQLPEARLLVDGEQPSSFSAHTEPQDFPSPVRSAYAVPEKDSYEAQLASGHRRAQAVQLLNDDETVTDAALEEIGLPPGFIPVDLQRLSDEEMLDVGTIENVQREWLSPIEEARGCRFHAQMGRTNDEIGELFGGRSASWVSSRKGLLELPKKVQMAVHEERISVRQAQALRDAYDLEEEHPEAKDVRILDADGLFESAKRGTKQSDDIRREVKRWKREITSGGEDDTEDFSPDVGTTHPEARGPARTDPESTEEHDDSNQNLEEAETSNEQADAGARTSADLSGNDGRPDAGRDASGEDADGTEKGTDEGKRNQPAGPTTVATEEVAGDGAPADESDGYATYPPVQTVIEEIESHDWLWEVGQEVGGTYHATVWIYDGDERLGSFSETEGEDPGTALMDAYNAAIGSIGDDIGQVVPAQVDTLLSADGEEMWDQAAADMSTIASLLVAHRVAGARQESWRTKLIVETVRERVGNVTEDDVPDDTMQAVRNEVTHRLETQAA